MTKLSVKIFHSELEYQEFLNSGDIERVIDISLSTAYNKGIKKITIMVTYERYSFN